MDRHNQQPENTSPRTKHRPQRLADLSLRTKLLVFAFALVTIPGALFAVIAFPGTQAALEREVGLHLHQAAERGADAVTSALRDARRDATLWAQQEVMRDLLVDDVDKRVSRFLQTARASNVAYASVLCINGSDRVVAADRGSLLGTDVAGWFTDGGGPEAGFVGPTRLPGHDGPVMVIIAPVINPDQPGRSIARLVVVYQWSALRARLADLRQELATLEKRIAAVIIDSSQRLLGGIDFQGAPVHSSSTGGNQWQSQASDRAGVHSIRLGSGEAIDALSGRAPILHELVPWSVIILEPAEDALAPVRAVRQRWLLIMAAILGLGLAVAALLARQLTEPLAQITRTTSFIAANPDRKLDPLPVHSGDEVGQLTQSFNQMTDELHQSQEETLSAAKFAFAGQLAAMVAHEVRTPLTVMRSSAQLLDRTPANGHHNEELVATIVDEVDRVERVVDGLIQLSRPLEHQPQATEVGELLKRAANFVGAEAERNQVELALDLRPAPAVHCDPDQIYQVILNLLVNALQVLTGGGRIAIGLMSVDPDRVRFEIADNGPGIPDDIREQMFQPFVTGREDGTGLGLAFVDRVIKAHRGTLEVESVAGGGSRFTITLPTARGNL